MSRFNVRPENALKRCEELIKVGMKDAALDILHTVLSNKRNRSTWQKVHEKIILRYLDLCVELRKGRIAKDGLHQYKSICQQMAIGSLEVAIRHLVTLSEAKADKARDEVSAAMEALEGIDDLDELESPESVMMSSVTPEAEKERKDRELLTPWLKFLWETYRTVLEILRNNNKLETLYQSIAQSAFAFCLKYQRKTELRRLGDMLRNHLQQIQKYSTNQNAVNLNAPESLQMSLETRFVQLSTATQLELWQEAYRGIEDIHNLMTLSKKAPKPQMLAAYYSKLGDIFWRSDNRLVHAAALHKLFALSVNQNKNLSDNDKKKMAGRLIIATLTIPVARVKGKAEEYLETDLYNKRSRLTTLLGSVQPPTRKQLVEEMHKLNVFAKGDDKMTELYKALEVDFNPLRLCGRVQPILDDIAADSELCMYIKPLQEIVLSRLLLQLSQVYATVKLEQITKLAPFYTVREIEYLIAKAVHNREMVARIDHKTRAVTFDVEAFCAQAPEVVRGPHIQVSRGEKMRGQLTTLAQALHTAIEKISEQSNGVLSLNPNYYDQKSRAMQDIVKNAHLENKKALERRVFIERNKERAEELAKEKERLDLKRKSDARRADIAAEQKRLVEESQKREEARAQREAETVKRASAIERMKELKTVMGTHSTVFDDLNVEEFSQMDAQEIVKKQVEFLDKEQQIQEQKLKSISRKLDHLERAKRQEEIPLYVAKYKERKEEDLVAWQHLQEKKDADALAKHQSDLETKNRMLTVMDHLSRHKERVVSTRRAEFEASESEFLSHVLRVRDERMQEERLEKERLEQERIAAEERARREEAERLEREEQRRREEEEEQQRREKERQQHEEEMARLREMEEKKLKREQEILNKQEAKLSEGPAPGGWRHREAEKQRGDQRDERAWRPSNQQPPRRAYGHDDNHPDSRRNGGSMFGSAKGGSRWQTANGDDGGPEGSGNAANGNYRAREARGGDRYPRGSDRDPRGGDRDPRGGDCDPRGGDRDPRGGDRDPHRGGSFGDRRQGDLRGSYGGDRGGGSWRADPPKQQQQPRPEAPPKKEKEQPAQPTVDDDGFTSVSSRRR